MLLIINRKLLVKTGEKIALMSVKYIGREKTLFPSGHLGSMKFLNALHVYEHL